MFQLFTWQILEKIEIIDIFITKRIKSILLNKYCFYLLLDFLINALLYSDEVVSHKSHNNGKLEVVVVLAITLSSKIISFILKFYLDKLIEFEEKTRLISEIGKEYYLLRLLKKFFKELILRTIIFLIVEICLSFFAFYYLIIFCTLIYKSQMSLLTNYLVSIIEDVIITFILIIIIIVLRKFGFYFKNKYLYNISKYINDHF